MYALNIFTSLYLFHHIQKHFDITMKLTIHSAKSVQFAIFLLQPFQSLQFFFANIFHLTNSRFSRLAIQYIFRDKRENSSLYEEGTSCITYTHDISFYYYLAVDEPKGCLFIFVHIQNTIYSQTRIQREQGTNNIDANTTRVLCLVSVVQVVVVCLNLVSINNTEKG